MPALTNRDLAPAIKHFAWLYPLVHVGAAIVWNLVDLSLGGGTGAGMTGVQVALFGMVCGIAGHRLFKEIGTGYTRALRARLAWWFLAVALGMEILVSGLGIWIRGALGADEGAVPLAALLPKIGPIVAGALIVGIPIYYGVARLGLYWLVPEEMRKALKENEAPGAEA